MLKIQKKEKITFLLIFLFSLIICSGFIKMHYTADTYRIADMGYKYYAYNYFLKDGRIFTNILLMIAYLLKLPIQITNYIFIITSIFISCISVIVLKNIILGIKPAESKKRELMVLVISYLAIFNFMYIETLYFLETVIMSTSILLYILATKMIIDKKKYYFYKALILTILGIVSYQGTISFFIILSIALLLIKHKTINKEFIKDGFFIALISLLTAIISLLEVKFIGDFYGFNQSRVNINNIVYNLLYILRNMSSILIDTCGFLPKYIFLCSILFLVIISFIYVRKEKNKDYSHIINIAFIIIATILASFVVFLSTQSSFNSGRMYVGLGSLSMLIILYLYCDTNIMENRELSIILNIFIMVTFIANTIYYISLTWQVQYKNHLEKEYCETIKQYLTEEKIEVENAGIICVRNMKENIYFTNIITRNNLAINEIRGYTAAISGFKLNTGYKLKEIHIDNDIVKKYYDRLKNNDKGIKGTYSMIIDGILIMPAFIW